jgi:hypothetical protein
LIEGCPFGFGHGQDVMVDLIAEAFASNITLFPTLNGL